MKKLLLAAIFCNNIYSQLIDIRPATVQDLPAIFELDERISYEFFKPLYTNIYQHLNVDRDVDRDLQKELELDTESFPNIINNSGLERLHVAWDTENNILCGIIVFSRQNNHEILLDLLLVDKNYRGKGIGKQLVNSMFSVFKDIKVVNVYPFKFNNENVLKFYELLGFKNCDLISEDKISIHDIRYIDLYYHFRLEVKI